MKMFGDLMRISFNKEAIWDGYSSEGFGAFTMLQQYVHGATTQWERIRQHRDALLADRAIDGPTILRNLFLDVHYFFICAGRIEKLIEKLSTIDDDEIMKDISRSNRELFKPYKNALNHLENVEGRFTGRFMSDFIQVDGDSFRIGGQRIDLCASSLEVLEGVYNEVVGGLLMKAG